MNGVLLIDKPQGMTSHDVVFCVRKMLNTKRVGHTGTLDKEVTGLLVIVIGQATKLTELMLEQPKSYFASVTLGVSTTTEDSHGTLLTTSDASGISDESIDRALQRFQGNYDQQVPSYSSVKVNGKKLYQYALENLPVERPIRTVTIYNINRTSEIVTEDHTRTFSIDVTTSKGTYIRTLAVDIGRTLHTDSHMSYLRRTKSCGFSIENAISLNEVAADKIIPLSEVFKDMFTIDVTGDEALRFSVSNGQKIELDAEKAHNQERILFRSNSHIIGLYKKDKAPYTYRPFKMFNLQES